VADVTDETAMRAAAETATRDRGAIDLLVANAGGVETAPFLRSDAGAFRRMLDLNLMGVVNSVHAVLPGMVERRFGRIVAVSSTAGLKGYAYVSAYCAAKHAVVGLVRALALETVQKGITVNALCPGYTETDMVRDSLAAVSDKTGRSHERVLGEVLKDKPLGRLVRPTRSRLRRSSCSAPRPPRSPARRLRWRAGKSSHGRGHDRAGPHHGRRGLGPAGG
jgi:NAD(P)-dependent dehydrogenase (short-subunit alcohol dehydrogenase family)